MTAVTPLALFKAQLNITDNTDDLLLAHKLAAAEEWIEAHLEFSTDIVSPSVTEAVLQLAAFWYENREAAIVGQSANLIPFGVTDLLRPYRVAVTGHVPE